MANPEVGRSVATATTDQRKAMLEKSKASRKVRQDKIAKLDSQGKFAIKCIQTASNNLAMAEELILSGRPVTSAFIQVLGNIQSATGEML